MRSEIGCEWVNADWRSEIAMHGNTRTFAVDTTRYAYKMSICTILRLQMLARPHTHGTVSATFYKVSVFDAYVLDDGVRCRFIFVSANARTAAPVSTICLVIHLYYIFACCGNNAARVEHHAGDRMVVSVGVGNGACSQVPDLANVSNKHSP